MTSPHIPTKKPVTGRSASERAAVRASTSTGAQALRSKFERKINLRTDIALGQAVRRLAADYPILRRLVATVRDEAKYAGVRRQLGDLAGKAIPLTGRRPSSRDFEDWQSVREKEQHICELWGAAETLLHANLISRDQLEPYLQRIEAAASDIDSLTSGSNPAGRAARFHFADRLPGFTEEEM